MNWLMEPGWTTIPRTTAKAYIFILLAFFCVMPLALALGARMSTQVIVLLIILIVLGCYLPLMRYEMRDVWECEYKVFRRSGNMTLDSVEAVLNNADVAYFQLGPRVVGTFFTWEKFENTFDLEHDSMRIMVSEGSTTVYIGPVNEANRKRVELLKGLMDEAIV